MIDIHTHLIPKVDDGSKSLEVSINIIKQEVLNGVTDIICTPHLNSYNLNSIDLIKKSFNDLKSKVSLVNLYLGSEIYYYDDFKKDLINGKIITLNESKYILIEFSTTYETPISDIVYEITLLGYKPIIAHIERYSYLTKDDILEIKRNGALIQVNTKSFERKSFKKVIKFLLKNNLIDFIASDCHDDIKRNVDFTYCKKIITKKYKSLYHKLFEEVPEFIRNDRNEA
ncbi:MAG: tyrosine-protein phosphatase [Anaeroplasma sp.]